MDSESPQRANAPAQPAPILAQRVAPAGRTNRSVALICLVVCAMVILAFELLVQLEFVDMPEVGVIAGLGTMISNFATFAVYFILVLIKWAVLLVTTTTGVVCGINGLGRATDDNARKRTTAYLVAQILLVGGYFLYRYVLFGSFASGA